MKKFAIFTYFLPTAPNIPLCSDVTFDVNDDVTGLLF